MIIYDEYKTVLALQQGHSIARFGDGELRAALGKSVGHQQYNKKLKEELNHILHKPTKCLVGVPYISEDSPKKHVWMHYNAPQYQKLYNPQKQYYSAFITRPDSAPWIDNEIYWNTIKALWKDKHVVCVSGSRKGFRLEEMEKDCASVQFVNTLKIKQNL